MTDIILKEPEQVELYDLDISVKRSVFRDDYSPYINNYTARAMESSGISLPKHQVEQLQEFIIEEVEAEIAGRKSDEKKMEGRTTDPNTHVTIDVKIDPLEERRKEFLERMGDREKLSAFIKETSDKIAAQYPDIPVKNPQFPPAKKP